MATQRMQMMKWLIKSYMAEAHIDSVVELSEATGITRRHLYDILKDPHRLKVYEIKALDDVLHFSEQDLLSLVRGKV